MLKERELLIRDMVNNHPLLLLTLKDEEEIMFVNFLLPFSIGIEIECNQKEDIFHLNNFNDIPNIMDVDCDRGEQRFRIPRGINGFLVLYHISEALKVFSELNPLSGIHYHVGVESNYPLLSSEQGIKENKNWILKELETWEYKGTYNTKGMGAGAYWLRTSQSQFKTLEFRLGEMTFDYELLVKRILHLSEIVKKYITNVGGKFLINDKEKIRFPKEVLKFEPQIGDIRTELASLYKSLNALDIEEKPIDDDEEEMTRIINNRIIKS